MFKTFREIARDAIQGELANYDEMYELGLSETVIRSAADNLLLTAVTAIELHGGEARMLLDTSAYIADPEPEPASDLKGALSEVITILSRIADRA